MNVISGHDSKDSTCLKEPVPDYLEALEKPLLGIRVGLIKECFEQEGLNSQVKESVLASSNVIF